jgi:polyhydroxyalkanoate synthesis regulator phasin
MLQPPIINIVLINIIKGETMYLPTKAELLKELLLAKQNITEALDACKESKTSDYTSISEKVMQQEIAAFYDRLCTLNREIAALEAKYAA